MIIISQFSDLHIFQQIESRERERQRQRAGERENEEKPEEAYNNHSSDTTFLIRSFSVNN